MKDFPSSHTQHRKCKLEHHLPAIATSMNLAWRLQVWCDVDRLFLRKKCLANIKNRNVVNLKSLTIASWWWTRKCSIFLTSGFSLTNQAIFSITGISYSFIILHSVNSRSNRTGMWRARHVAFFDCLKNANICYRTGNT